MTTCSPIEVLPEEALALERDFRLGPIQANGSRYLTEGQVVTVGGLKISVFSDEHPPPHFRVDFQGESANFEITTGNRLPGQRGLERFNRNIAKWWKQNKLLVATAWNSARPTDCTVGVVDTVALGWEAAPAG